MKRYTGLIRIGGLPCKTPSPDHSAVFVCGQRHRSWLGSVLLFTLWLILFGFSSVTLANPVATPHVRAQLISEATAVQANQSFWVALHLNMRDGWHTYWRNPGDSGLATTIEWKLPAGFVASDIYWPYPEAIAMGPLVNYGYHGDVYLLVQLTPPATLKNREKLTLTADADWLVCEENCIPEQATLTLTLPVTSDAPRLDDRWKTGFIEARQALPKPNPWQASFSLTSDQLTLTLDALNFPSERLKKARFFPKQDGIIENAAAQTLTISDDQISLATTRGAQRNVPLSRLQGVLVLQEDLTGTTATQALEIDASATTAAANTPPTPFGYALILALLGGMVLNLMPCVFPVLSVKVLHFAHQAHNAPTAVRWHGVVFTTGVLVSFALIAGLLLLLRAGGAQIGWGFQLQSPFFVTTLAYLLFILGLSLSGALTLGARLMDLGSGWATRSDYMGTFATGGLATLVATPCTAPFMGTALGYALTQPWPTALAVFQALGFGFALPYLVLSFKPSLLRFLPKPGPWMARFKEFLAFPLYATAAWLIWVLSQQTGPTGVAVALTGLILIALAIWLLGTTAAVSRRWRLLGRLSAVAALISALALAQLPQAITPDSLPQTAMSNPKAGDWELFSPQRLAELRAGNQPVFVNFTAAWCITCLVNERVALSSPRVKAGLAEAGITYLKADWTNHDPAITTMLASFGRSGVPLYVLYPPAQQGTEPIVLPQILTESLVLKAIKSLENTDPS